MHSQVLLCSDKVAVFEARHTPVSSQEDEEEMRYKEQPGVTGSHIINYKLKARVYANILGALLSWVMDLTHLTPGLINLLQRPITTSFKFVLFPSQFWEF